MIQLMPSRLAELTDALAGYQQTHTHFVALGAQGLHAAGLGNDLGPFYFIIKMAAGGMELTQAINIFFTQILLIGLIAGLIGITLLWSKSKYYGWSVGLLVMLALITYKVGDVYTVSTAAVIGLVPYVMLLIRNRALTVWAHLGWVAIGVACGFANSFRAQSGTTVALFAFVALVVAAGNALTRARLGALLVIGMLLPSIWLGNLVKTRDAYLAEHVAGYTPAITAHPFWHTAYIGFGFLHNDLGISYLDEVGIAKVASVDPTVKFLSPQYETILRTETLNLVKSHPLFVILTVFAKLGILVLLYLTFFANWGLLRAWRERIGGKIYWPFYVSAAFAGLAGIVAIPELRYVTGFAALAVLYGLTVLNDGKHERR